MTIRVTRKRPDAYQHGDLRRALVNAGLKLLSEKGVDGLSLRAAAELAGVSHAAPYRHFRDKNALVAAIGEEGFRLLTRSMRDEVTAAGTDDLFGRLRALGRGYVGFAVHHPAYFRIVFSGMVHGQADDPESVALRAAGQESYDVLRELVVEGVRGGALRAGDPDQLALAAWSMVHGLSMLLVERQLSPAHEDEAQVRAMTESVLGLLERGVRAG